MAEPTYLSSTPENTDLTAANLGAKTLGLPLFEQGEHVARVLEAKDEDGLPLYPTAVLLMPRRSTKTTSIWNVLIGRCLSIEGYKVVTTAQSQKLARNRFMEVARILTAAGFEESGQGQIKIGNGQEEILFSNGSRLWVVAPNAGSLRGEAADCMLFDEAGEYDVERSEDLVAGALPLMDTRPQGQVIIAGTPAKSRVGLFWDTLQDGRSGDPATGIVDYSIRDDEQSVDAEGNLNVDVLRRVHPGIGTLTTLAKMRARFEKMQLPQFEREYLCRFPFDNSVRAIDLEKWSHGHRDISELGENRPERIALGYEVDFDGSSAVLVAAWRDDEGNAHGAVVRHSAGWEWLTDAAAKEAVKFNRAPIAYDLIGKNITIAERLHALRPQPRIVSLPTRSMISAASILSTDIAEGRIVHYDQKAMNAAVEHATWRNVSNHTGRLFARSDDISAAPVIAFSLALHTYDNMPKGGGAGMVFG